MNMQFSLQDYARLVCNINAEVVATLKQSFQASPGLYLVEANEATAPDILAIHNQTRLINLHSVLVPFGIDSALGYVSSFDKVTLIAHARRRLHKYGPWLQDHSFGENGVFTLCIPSLDADDVAAAALRLADEIKMHLSFELECAQ